MNAATKERSIMELKRIKEMNCPHCRARIDGETCERLHSNGLWNEYRTFYCGHRLHFSPNGMCVETVTPCPSDPKAVAAKQLRVDLLDNIRALVEAAGVDDAFKRKITDYLPYP
jgi:hypothetical protein